uniref:Nuclear receptor domain-containing protein n=1 Tax=Meloidogyne incognita TaxID=6306 RepID=A0A914M8T7_MELIC
MVFYVAKASCKQFFRRIIIKQKIPTCIMNYRCDITQGDRCQGCRFNKCLLMGMDASLICVQNPEDLDKFIENLKEYQLEVIARYYEQIAPNNDNQLDYDFYEGRCVSLEQCLEF